MHIYVVDNNIPAGRPCVPQSYFSDQTCVTLLEGHINGPCQARNLAITCMRPAEYVFFLDDDITVPFGYFELAIDSFRKSGGDIITFNTYKISNPVIASARRLIIFLIFCGAISDPRGLVKKVAKCNVVSGGNFAIKGEIVSRILWDEGYLGYSFGEDVDYGVRASKILTILYDPSVNLNHHSMLKNSNESDLLKRYFGLAYVLKKNFSFSSLMIINYGFVIFLKSLFLFRIKFAIKMVSYYIPWAVVVRNPKHILSRYLEI